LAIETSKLSESSPASSKRKTEMEMNWVTGIPNSELTLSGKACQIFDANKRMKAILSPTDQSPVEIVNSAPMTP